MLTRKTFEIPKSLTHDAGQIEAEFSAATYSVSLATLTANTLYFLYLLKVSNVPTLSYSTSLPSSIRNSFPDAVLVGAFYSNGMTTPVFGSFVNIEGIPTTARPVSSNLTMDAGTPFTRTNIVWSRKGRDFHATISALKDGTAGVGATPFEITLPLNLPNFANPSSSPGPNVEIAQENGGNLGFLTGTQIGGVADWIQMEIYVVSLTNIFRLLAQPAGTGTIVKTAIAAGATLQGFVTPIPLSGWDSTPLKDL